MAVGRRTLLEVGMVALALAAGLAPIPAAIIERSFSITVYPVIQRTVTPVSNLIGFAVLDVISAALLVVVAIAIVRSSRASWRARAVRPLLRTGGHLAAGAACGYLLFLVLWGFNYRRVSMEDRLLVEGGSPSSVEVEQLGLDAVARMNDLYADAHRAGWQGEEWRDESLRSAFESVLRALSDAPGAEPGRLKRSLFGLYFQRAGVDGMVNPFGLEVLANPDLLPFERPFVAAHEWAHLAGYAHEAEANLVGWLTTVRGDVPTQYSGWLYLFWQVNGEVDGKGRARLAEALAPGPRQDVEAIVARVRRSQLPWLRTAGWAVYDQYLKANRVESGVRSYGEVLTLILQARFEDGWTPVRRPSRVP